VKNRHGTSASNRLMLTNLACSISSASDYTTALRWTPVNTTNYQDR